ncbi:Hypothetical predicted protein, partial [Olea europaea subsp. europaea]
KKQHRLATAIERTAAHDDVDRSMNHTTTINDEQQRNGSPTSKIEKEEKGPKPSLAASRCCRKCPPAETESCIASSVGTDASPSSPVAEFEGVADGEERRDRRGWENVCNGMG